MIDHTEVKWHHYVVYYLWDFASKGYGLWDNIELWVIPTVLTREGRKSMGVREYGY